MKILVVLILMMYTVGLLFNLMLGYHESQYRFSGYQVKHVIFWTYPLGRVVYKVFNIKLTKGE